MLPKQRSASSRRRLTEGEFSPQADDEVVVSRFDTPTSLIPTTSLQSSESGQCGIKLRSKLGKTDSGKTPAVSAIFAASTGYLAPERVPEGRYFSVTTFSCSANQHWASGQRHNGFQFCRVTGQPYHVYVKPSAVHLLLFVKVLELQFFRGFQNPPL